MLLRTASFSVGLHVVRAPFDPLRPPDGFRTSSPNNKPFLFLAHVYVCFDTAQVVCGKLWGWGTLLGTTVHSFYETCFFHFRTNGYRCYLEQEGEILLRGNLGAWGGSNPVLAGAACNDNDLKSSSVSPS